MSIPILAVTDEGQARVSGNAAGAFGACRAGRELRRPAGQLPRVHRRCAEPAGLLRAREPRRRADSRCSGSESCKPSGAIDLSGKVIQDPATGHSRRDSRRSALLRRQTGAVFRVGDRAHDHEEWHPPAPESPATPWPLPSICCVSHAPRRAMSTIRPDPAHRGFETLRGFLEKWRPAYPSMGTCTSMTAPSPSPAAIRGYRRDQCLPLRSGAGTGAHHH